MLLNGTISRWRQRIGYGSADFACNLIWTMISLYLLYFYTDVMKLNPTEVGLMFIITRFIDAGADLIVGYCIDRTKSKWGKSRPYFLFGAVPFAIFAMLTFSVPDISHSGKLLYAYITYIGLSIMYSLINIPLSSILPSLTADMEERTVLSTTRMFFGFVGASVVSATTLKLVTLFGSGNDILGFRLVMILFGIIGLVIFLFTFLNVREIELPVVKKITLKESIASLGENKPWLIFALNIVFMWSGYFLQTSAIVYYYKVFIGNTDLSVLVATLMTIIPVIVNFSVPCLAKIGKRNLFVISSVVQLIGIVIIWIANISYSIILAGVICTAIGQGVKTSIYFSMQADPVDYGEWKTGINTTGIQNAINGFIGKVCMAITGGVSGFLLDWGKYQAGLVTQTENALLAIKCMYLYVPMVLIICSIITISFYNLDKILPKIKEENKGRNIVNE